MDFVDRFALLPLVAAFVLYPLVAWPTLRWAPSRVRMPLLAVTNICFLALLCLLSGAGQVRIKSAIPYAKIAAVFFLAYVVVALLHYVSLQLMVRRGGGWVKIAFLLPLVLLVYVKYLSDHLMPFRSTLANVHVTHIVVFFTGISYLSFRLVHLAQEVRNELVEMPTLAEYMAFAFFTPTLSIGPISPYSKFIRSVREPSRVRTPLERSLLRIVIGFTKYLFLGSLAAQFSYGGQLLDGHPHSVIDVLIAAVAYPVYLYLNFSGFCDIVIGISGLLQIEVMENFDRPFLARNIQEFWNRWHITLSLWIRDLAFTPMTKMLIRWMGSKRANDAIALAIFISFIGVGIWHGNGWNFVIFGALQGAGLAAVHYYTIWLKKRLGRERFAAYRNNTAIRVAAVVVNFLYFAFSLFFFANSWAQMHVLYQALHSR